MITLSSSVDGINAGILQGGNANPVPGFNLQRPGNLFTQADGINADAVSGHRCDPEIPE